MLKDISLTIRRGEQVALAENIVMDNKPKGIKREICRHPRGCVPARNPGGFSLRAERSL